MESDDQFYYRALQFATSSHADQIDNHGLPYILHPVRVAENFKNDPVLRVAALLHDVVEDCGVTVEKIEKLFGARVSYIVDKVSRREGESYFDFIDRVATHPLAIKLKLADIRDNLYNRGHCPSGMEARYLKAVKILEKAKQDFEYDNMRLMEAAHA